MREQKKEKKKKLSLKERVLNLSWQVQYSMLVAFFALLESSLRFFFSRKEDVSLAYSLIKTLEFWLVIEGLAIFFRILKDYLKQHSPYFLVS